MGTTVYWRPFKGREAQHYWTDDTLSPTVKSACGQSVSRTKLDVYTGFAEYLSLRCKHCIKKLEKKP